MRTKGRLRKYHHQVQDYGSGSFLFAIYSRYILGAQPRMAPIEVPEDNSLATTATTDAANVSNRLAIW